MSNEITIPEIMQFPEKIMPGEVIFSTECYRVVSGFREYMEGLSEGACLFVEPRDKEKNLAMLFQAAMTHHYYDFAVRPVPMKIGLYYVPSFVLPYNPEPLRSLFTVDYSGFNHEELVNGSIPSVIRLQQSREQMKPYTVPMYTLVDGKEPEIPYPISRQLRVLDTAYSDEIPREMISGKSQHLFYKVRRNWFNLVAGYMSIGIEMGEFGDHSLISDMSDFANYVTSDYFHKKVRNTREEIEWANGLIRRAVALMNQESSASA